MEYHCLPFSVNFQSFRGTFQIFNPNDGKTQRFLIQDIPEHMYEFVVQLMATHFANSDPLRMCLGFFQDSVSVNEEKLLWRNILKQGFSLICFAEVEGSFSEIAGISMNYKRGQNDPQPTFQGHAMKTLTDLTNFLIEKYNFYEQYNVTEVVIGIGDILRTRYNFKLLLANMMESRGQLSKLIGLNMNFSLALSEQLQTCLADTGFKPHVVMAYEALEKIDERFCLRGIQEYGKSIQLMYKFY